MDPLPRAFGMPRIASKGMTSRCILSPCIRDKKHSTISPDAKRPASLSAAAGNKRATPRDPCVIEYFEKKRYR